MDEMIFFKTNSGQVFPIATSVLKRYPTSFLSTMAFSSFKGNHKNGFVNIFSITNEAMNVIVEFYYIGVWKNPYLYKNIWSIPECGNSLEDKCLFLGLPDYVEYDDQEDEEEDRLWEGMCFKEEELKIIKDEFFLEKEFERIEKENEDNEELIYSSYNFN